MPSNIIYTDVDWVLHDYTKSFEQVLREDGIRIDDHDRQQIEKINLTDIYYSLQGYVEYFEITYNRLAYYIKQANLQRGWIPTPFGEKLADFLRGMIKNGIEVYVITARETRDGVDSILKDIFQTDKIPPTFTCLSHDKYKIVHDNCIIFDDHWKVANSIAEYVPTTTVYVPKWPWNAYRTAIAPNIELLEHDDLLDKLDFLQRSYEEKSKCDLSPTK